MVSNLAELAIFFQPPTLVSDIYAASSATTVYSTLFERSNSYLPRARELDKMQIDSESLSLTVCTVRAPLKAADTFQKLCFGAYDYHIRMSLKIIFSLKP